MEFPPGVVESHEGEWYVVKLDGPVTAGFGEARTLKVAARHRGYPVSAATVGRAVPVNGQLSTGQQFIAFITVSPSSNRWSGP